EPLMAKAVLFEKEARQALKKMARPTAIRIVEKVEQYAADPASLASQVKQLASDRRKRLRVGSWRVLFVEDATSVAVLDVRSRGSAYKV
ncbi:MAG: type II toxin-antitoxin system RelE/ParE family toxin, partial [Bauldia sp.]